MQKRISEKRRSTTETDIKVRLNLDGEGKAKIKTGIGLLDHLLKLFAFHGLFDLEIEVVKQDLEIDTHHSNEDIGIVLGEAFKDALGDKKGIRRYGFGSVPMDETLAQVSVDLGGRYFFSKVWPGLKDENYSTAELNDFMESFAQNARINLHIEVKGEGSEGAPKDLHHLAEAVFKAFARALYEAASIDPRRAGVPSTKGIL